MKDKDEFEVHSCLDSSNDNLIMLINALNKSLQVLLLSSWKLELPVI